MTRLSCIVTVLAQSTIALVVVGCMTTDIDAYPRYWPAMPDEQRRCAIEGEYLNAGGVGPDGKSPGANEQRRLSASLRPDALGPIGASTADRVGIAVAGSTLIVTVPGEPATTSLPMRGDLDFCIEQGGYQIEFSEPYGGEGGAGAVHITQTLALAADGSLVVRSRLFYDASRSVIVRHKDVQVVWYRFMRVAQSEAH